MQNKKVIVSLYNESLSFWSNIFYLSKIIQNNFYMFLHLLSLAVIKHFINS